MGLPAQSVQLPRALRHLQQRRGLGPETAVWVNELGGLTFRFDGIEPAQYVKWAPNHPEHDLEGEARRLRWARPYVPVRRLWDAT